MSWATGERQPDGKPGWPGDPRAPRKAEQLGRLAIVMGALGTFVGWLSYVAILFLGSPLPAYPGVAFGVPAIGLGAYTLKHQRGMGWSAIALGIVGCIIFVVSLSFV
jgi:hypothetical protein